MLKYNLFNIDCSNVDLFWEAVFQNENRKYQNTSLASQDQAAEANNKYQQNHYNIYFANASTHQDTKTPITINSSNAKIKISQHTDASRNTASNPSRYVTIMHHAFDLIRSIAFIVMPKYETP